MKNVFMYYDEQCAFVLVFSGLTRKINWMDHLLFYY